MAIDPRTYINYDKRHPASLSGEAGKALVVNSGENGYETASYSTGHHNDILGGDATVSGNTLTFTPCTAWDSTRLILLETTADTDVDLPETVSATQILYFIYLVKLDSDGSCEFRAYTAKTGAGSPEEDAEITHYRYRTFWRTFTDGAAVLAVLTGNYLTFGKSSQCVSTVSLTNLFATVDHSDLLDVDALDLIEYGGKSSSGAAVYILSSLDGTNFENFQVCLAGSNTDTNILAWGYYNYSIFKLTPFVSTRQFKLDTSSAGAALLFKTVKLKL